MTGLFYDPCTKPQRRFEEPTAGTCVPSAVTIHSGPKGVWRKFPAQRITPVSIVNSLLEFISQLSRETIMSECPVCGAQLTLSEDLVKSELLECDDCGTELEVIALNPVVLKEAPETEEDWGQ